MAGQATDAAAATESAPLIGQGGTAASAAYNSAVASAEATDEYIISLIRRTSTRRAQDAPKQHDGAAATVDDNHDEVSLEDSVEEGASMLHHQTTYAQTLIHLIKGYIGCGILSLPWAISQLGIPFGLCGIVIMSLWSSYNCWTVVQLKRYIERNELQKTIQDHHSDDGAAGGGGGEVASSIHGSTTAQSVASSQATSNVTYPDVGEWAHGVDFQNYVAACICTQQLAICTVFMSFVGENLYAVLQFLNVSALNNHGTVISVVMPVMMALSFLPSLKSLAPVMLMGTILIFAGFGSLGMIGVLEWEDRPGWEDIPTLNPVKAPMALCGILYSFEGICIILPVESAMKEPQHFKSAFWISMSVVTMLLCAVAGLSVLAFGDVTNGSITAFLLEEYKDDDRLKLLLMMCNLLVSFSIILTYPLQLFPAVELVAPMMQEWMHKHRKWIPFGNKEGMQDDDDDSSEHDLEGFEPMTEIPEHEVASLGSLPSQSQYHEYGADTTQVNTNGEAEETAKTGEGADNASLSRLSSMGYQSVADMMPEWHMPGDSPALRAMLVLSSYVVAMVVPNVESLVSLAGAVAGSSTALLIPPILELAWIRHLEKDGIGLGDWEGGPSAASKTTLVQQQHSSSDNGITTGPALPSKRNHHRTRKRKSFWKEKAVSWFLLGMGIIFAAFGSYFSVQDIVQTYLSPSPT
jgi:proton-coupled amino acid transporter